MIEILSNELPPERNEERRKDLKNIDFEVMMQPLIHIAFSYCTICQILADCEVLFKINLNATDD